jgi:hypothetical protein
MNSALLEAQLLRDQSMLDVLDAKPRQCCDGEAHLLQCRVHQQFASLDRFWLL